jgi:hypothetical protein
VHKTDLFTVQRCLDARTLTFDAGQKVIAPGPLAAAEEVVAGSLSLTGAPDTLAARVLRLTDAYRPDAILVYRQRQNGQ